MVTLKDQLVMLKLCMIFRIFQKACVFFTLFSSILSDLSLVVSYFIRKLVYHFLTRPKMTWSEEHDIMLCRELLVEEPYNFKHGSRERGRCWDRIAEALNKIDQPKFIVDQRAVRDRFVKLEKACKKKTRDELRASGFAPSEPSELDQALEEIIEKSKSAEQQKEASCAEKQQEIDKEKETAEAVRRRAMERLSESRAREGCRKRKGGETSEYVGYLREKREVDMRVRENQVDLKRREVTIEERRVEREFELKQRELLLRERELCLKEKKLELNQRASESFQERLVGYEQQQIVLQQQLFSLQQQMAHLETINEDILKLLKTKENQ